MPGSVTIEFDSGTILLEIEGAPPPPDALDILRYDERVFRWRAQAADYAPLFRIFHAAEFQIADHAKAYHSLELTLHNGFPPMNHQANALKAWKDARGRGMVVMPTGSGKSYLAVLAILSVQRSAMVIAPTIDLVQQWASSLRKFLGCEIGMLGGGVKEIRDITVSTYDSAVIFMEHIGAQFGLVIFDECHHLPGPVNRQAAAMSLAPYRLALTATPERDDGGEAVIYRLVGPKVYEIFIDELEGRVLSPYTTHCVSVELSPSEAEEYQAARKIYTDFIRTNGINFKARDGWNQFIMLAARRPNGRAALLAYLKQRGIARCGNGKLQAIWEILIRHRQDRTIIFTADNDAAYAIGNHFCFPVITHKTKTPERKDFLDRFRNGDYRVLVTSKVLNEGVDVPEAAVGIVVSGSGSSREHVQRLGRILRASEGKQADLYELISEGTSEIRVSERRRNHRAYSDKHETEPESC